MRSKISTFASTAMPMVSRMPAIPGRVSVACRTDDECTTGECNLGLPVGLTVALTDQFNQPKVYHIKAAKRLCAPADKNGEGLQDAAAHLMCYQVAQARGVCGVGSPSNAGGACRTEVDCGGAKGVTTHCALQAVHAPVLDLRVNNQFGPALLDTIKESELCVPSAKTRP